MSVSILHALDNAQPVRNNKAVRFIVFMLFLLCYAITKVRTKMFEKIEKTVASAHRIVKIEGNKVIVEFTLSEPSPENRSKGEDGERNGKNHVLCHVREKLPIGINGNPIKMTGMFLVSAK